MLADSPTRNPFTDEGGKEREIERERELVRSREREREREKEREGKREREQEERRKDPVFHHASEASCGSVDQKGEKRRTDTELVTGHESFLRGWRCFLTGVSAVQEPTRHLHF